jgi:tRNA-guanine family transglycosylase
MLLTEHNLHHYQDLMRRIRTSIEAGKFSEFQAEAISKFQDKH